MTPKEKAISIMKLMMYSQGYTVGAEDRINSAKQCTLITVEEILNYTKEKQMPMGSEGSNDETYEYDEYWLEVKQEIEKL